MNRILSRVMPFGPMLPLLVPFTVPGGLVRKQFLFLPGAVPEATSDQASVVRRKAGIMLILE